MQDMMWVITHSEEQVFISICIKFTTITKKEDGKYPNRLAFLITDCNLLLFVFDTNPLHAGDA